MMVVWILFVTLILLLIGVIGATLVLAVLMIINFILDMIHGWR